MKGYSARRATHVLSAPEFGALRPGIALEEHTSLFDICPGQNSTVTFGT